MATPTNRAAINRLIQRHLKQFPNKGVSTIRPGYKFTGGWITDKSAIVATVDRKLDGLLPQTGSPRKSKMFMSTCARQPACSDYGSKTRCNTPWSPAMVERNIKSRPGSMSATSGQGQHFPPPRQSDILRSSSKGINQRSPIVRGDPAGSRHGDIDRDCPCGPGRRLAFEWFLHSNTTGISESCVVV